MGGGGGGGGGEEGSFLPSFLPSIGHSQPPGPNYRLEIGRTFRPISDNSALNRALPLSLSSSYVVNSALPQSSLRVGGRRRRRGQVMAPRSPFNTDYLVMVVFSRFLPFFTVHTSLARSPSERSRMIVSYRHCDFERRVIIDSPPWRYLVLENEKERKRERAPPNPDLCLH